MTARVPIGIVRSLDRPADPAGLLPDAEPAAGVNR
jgi:hypothetical protein